MAKNKDLEEFVETLEDTGLEDRLRAFKRHQIPVFVAGPPGVGKSARIAKVLKEDCDFVREERPSQWDPIDARGVPIVRRRLNEYGEKLNILEYKLKLAKATGDQKEVEGVAQAMSTLIAEAENVMAFEKTTEIQWPHLDFLPPIGFEGRVGLFFDELNTAPSAVQNVLLQPFQANPGEKRKIGPHTIYGSHVWLVAAGNRPEDVAYVNPMAGPLRNRFHIIEVNVDKTLIRNWTNWAKMNDIHPHVVGFINFRTEQAYQPPAGDFDAFPSPRSWSEQVSPLLKDGITGVEAYKGAVGKGAAVEFMSFLTELKDMPDIDKLLKHAKKTGNVDFNFKAAPLSITYATMMEMVYRSRDDHALMEPAMTIANSVRPEHAAVFVANLIRDEDKSVVISALGTSNIRAWATKHQHLIRVKD